LLEMTQPSIDPAVVRASLANWSSDDSALFVEAVRALSHRPLASTAASAAVVATPLPAEVDEVPLEKLLTAEQQAAYARYVYSNGRRRKDCAEPYVFLRDATEKTLRTPQPK
jgi:hypothetical protein